MNHGQRQRRGRGGHLHTIAIVGSGYIGQQSGSIGVGLVIPSGTAYRGGRQQLRMFRVERLTLRRCASGAAGCTRADRQGAVVLLGGAAPASSTRIP